MKNLILFGMQGAGKGTQARLLAEKFGFQIFETGAELRKLTQEDSELGKKVKEIVERGDLVPNEIVMEIIGNFIDGVAEDTPILFDGIPRSMEQKNTFDVLVTEHDREIFGIFIDIDREEAITRLLERGRSDDNQAAIAKRLANYEKETLPVIEQYEEEGVLQRVNGMQQIEEVFTAVSAVVEQHM